MSTPVQSTEEEKVYVNSNRTLFWLGTGLGALAGFFSLSTYPDKILVTASGTTGIGNVDKAAIMEARKSYGKSGGLAAVVLSTIGATATFLTLISSQLRRDKCRNMCKCDGNNSTDDMLTQCQLNCGAINSNDSWYFIIALVVWLFIVWRFSSKTSGCELEVRM